MDKPLFQLRGVNVYRVDERRKKPEDIQDGFLYYDIRHSDEDWGNPATVEKSVFVNHFGFLVTREPLLLTDGKPEEENKYIILSEDERSDIIMALNGEFE